MTHATCAGQIRGEKTRSVPQPVTEGFARPPASPTATLGPQPRHLGPLPPPPLGNSLLRIRPWQKREAGAAHSTGKWPWSFRSHCYVAKLGRGKSCTSYGVRRDTTPLKRELCRCPRPRPRQPVRSLHARTYLQVGTVSLQAVSEHTTARPDDPGPAAGGSGRPGPPHPGPRPASSRGGPTQGPSSHPTPPKHLTAGQERPRGRRPLAESRRRHRPRAVCPAGSREARAHARRRGASSPRTSSRTARRHAGLRGRDGPKNGRRAWRRVCAMRLLANRGAAGRGQRLTNTRHGFTRRTAGGDRGPTAS